MSAENVEQIEILHPCKQGKSLTVIVPVYNESDCIVFFHNRLGTALKNADISRKEIIYINDGSSDNSLKLLMDIVKFDPDVQVVDFSRNFGKEAAMTAGINQSTGDAVVLIDADLQDPPELIPQMVKHWQQGWDIVNMKRSSRAGESLMKKQSANLFYTLMGKMGPVKMPSNVGDFRLMSRRSVEAVKRMTEYNRFMKGMFGWIGYPTKEMLYERDVRYAGKSKWNYWKLWNFALDGMTSYSIAPLKISTCLGLGTSILSFFYGIFVVIRTLLYGDPVPGFPSLFVVILFLGGLQLLAIGIAGEYLGRIFLETKRRPLYLVKDLYKNRSIETNMITKISKRNIV